MNRTRCPDETDTVRVLRFTILLNERIREGDRNAIVKRQRRILRVAECISGPTARRLRDRLVENAAQDSLGQRFALLSTPLRNKILATFDQTAGAHQAEVGRRQAITASTEAFADEIEATAQEFLRQTPRRQLQVARVVLQTLKNLPDEPRFAQVDRKLVAQIAQETRRLELILAQVQVPGNFDVQQIVPREGSPEGGLVTLATSTAVPLGAGIGLAQAAPSAAVGGGTALGLGAVAVGGVAVLAVVAIGYWWYQRRNSVRLTDATSQAVLNLSALQVARQLAEASEVAERFRPEFAEADDSRPWPEPIPPLDEEYLRPRRKGCRRSEEYRGVGKGYARRHNAYCEALAAKRAYRGNPKFELVVHTGEVRRTKFDLYDPDTNTYVECKTRHEYANDDANRVAWLARTRWWEQAAKQKETLVRCDPNGTLEWVVETFNAYRAASDYLKGMLVDTVTLEPFPSKRKTNPAKEAK